MSSGDKPILSSKFSVMNFCRFRYLADFDIKIVPLGQNSFECIAFWWVEYFAFQTYIETLTHFFSLSLR